MAAEEGYEAVEVELEDSDDDFQYEEVEVLDDDDDVNDDIMMEDLNTALRSLQALGGAGGGSAEASGPGGETQPEHKITKHPEVIDDFIRNFLVKVLPSILSPFGSALFTSAPACKGCCAWYAGCAAGRPSLSKSLACVQMGMLRSLEQFESEWYELKAKGQLPADVGQVPDAYMHTRVLEDEVAMLRRELNDAKVRPCLPMPLLRSSTHLGKR